MSYRVLLLACSAAKLDHGAQAVDVYQGAIFRKGLEYAKREGLWVMILSAKHGWLAAVLGAMGTARVVAKPFSIALQTLLARVLAFVHETADMDDDEFVAAMLKKRWYRVLACAWRKLPTALPASATSTTDSHE